jgi:hypothetical protein
MKKAKPFYNNVQKCFQIGNGLAYIKVSPFIQTFDYVIDSRNLTVWPSTINIFLSNSILYRNKLERLSLSITSTEA